MANKFICSRCGKEKSLEGATLWFVRRGMPPRPICKKCKEEVSGKRTSWYDIFKNRRKK